MKRKLNSLLLLSLLVMSVFAMSESLLAAPKVNVPGFREYVKSVQTIFASEAARRNKFPVAVQTARLLGLLEVVDEAEFPKFYNCIVKSGRDWGGLNARTRENVIDECKTFVKGRQIAGVTAEAERKPAAPSAAWQGNILTLVPIQEEINKLSTKMDRIESTVTTLRNSMDGLDRSVRDLSRSVAGAGTSRAYPVPAPRVIQPQIQQPEEMEGIYRERERGREREDEIIR